MPEIEVHFTEPLKGVQLLDAHQMRSFVLPEEVVPTPREPVRQSDAAGELAELRKALTELRNRLTTQRHQPTPPATDVSQPQDVETNVRTAHTPPTRQALQGAAQELEQVVALLRQEAERLQRELPDTHAGQGESP